DHGTLFLDEIAEMPLTTQVKLLRAIELKEFMPIGAETVTKVDVRYIAATNKDLQNEVDQKKFRQDLYFRLKAVTLHIPPLRKRKSDIEELAVHFLRGFRDKNNIGSMRLSDEALEVLIRYSWPGNIRELKNAVETAAALAKSSIIRAEDLYPILHNVSPLAEPRNLPVALGKTPADMDREFILRALFEIKKDILELKDMLHEQQIESDKSVKTEEIFAMQDIEKRAIVNALHRTNNNKRLAAKILGISERTLYRKLKEFDITFE
ncbi:MAG: sigma 54-interacting transcriptional regulator, partial [Ignavibacteria bacterium]|nr:sigma 54-interacting transcriptional regulator [Ignavibacteria bacterium]